MGSNLTEALNTFNPTDHRRTTPAMPTGPARPEPATSGLVEQALARHDVGRQRVEVTGATGPERPTG